MAFSMAKRIPQERHVVASAVKRPWGRPAKAGRLLMQL